ncbi:MAG: redoxin domain-containing protein [Solirubrobacterales bacterium]
MKAAGALVVLALIAGAVVSLVMLFDTKGPVGSEHLNGTKLPQFAAPLAGGGLSGDANIYSPEEAKAKNAKAACDVDLKGSINSCDGLKGAAVLLFFNSEKSECVAQVDKLDQVLRQKPGVNAIALAFDETANSAAATASKKSWKLPVAADPDGAVAALYSVAGCPSAFFAQDGVIRGVKLGVQSPEQLSQAIEQYTK